MVIVQINATCGVGSTGAICLEISKLLNKGGVDNYVLYSNDKSDYPQGIKYASNVYIKLQALKSRLFGNYGFNGTNATKVIISHLKKIKPDIVHLHNLHGHNCNLSLLLGYLKQQKIKVVWTFHDCWTVTGYCPYFDMANCNKWKNGCKSCPSFKAYSWFFDRSEKLYNKKKTLINDLDLTIVTPSKWLADVVDNSFVKNCKAKVIYNGIDIDVFRPRKSDFRQAHSIGNKKIVLGVAFDWGPRKGLDVFVRLAERLDRDKYQIVLVGTNPKTEKQLPDNIISIRRTKNQAELAEIYTAADVFVNPTREEVLGLTNIEANACGTPVITFRTGGSPECIDEASGVVVEKDDVLALEREVVNLCENAPFDADACRARAKQFDKKERFAEYRRLYETINS